MVGGNPPAARVDLLHGRLDDLLADGACDLVLHHSSISRHRDLNASTPLAARDERLVRPALTPQKACERAGGAKIPLLHGVACTRSVVGTFCAYACASEASVFEYQDFTRRGTRARARPARARPRGPRAGAHRYFSQRRPPQSPTSLMTFSPCCSPLTLPPAQSRCPALLGLLSCSCFARLFF